MLESFQHLTGEEAQTITWWQMGVRATIIFFWAVLLYRLFPRRAFGSSSTTDIVLVVIVGSALSRALTGTVPLLPTMFATALLGVFYGLVIQFASRHRLLGAIVKGRSIRLVDDGELDRSALRRARMSEGDLYEVLRLNGVTDMRKVAAAYLERNGAVSVVQKS